VNAGSRIAAAYRRGPLDQVPPVPNTVPRERIRPGPAADAGHLCARGRYRANVLDYPSVNSRRGRPSSRTVIKPGRSGNPKGRPKGSRNLATDLAAELGEQI